MFSETFYPTPIDVAKRMCEGVKGIILEPSAGKGDLLKPLDGWHSGVNKQDIYCIEFNYELQEFLISSNYNVIHDDFLTYKPDIFFDYIIMNPPFDFGAKHLLKAIEISHGAEIRCLLNAETLNNPYSKERQILTEILNKNEAEVIDLGQCFSDAERKTNVNVVLVILKEKDAKDVFSFNFLETTEKHKLNFDSIPENQLAKIDLFENLESRYDIVAQLFLELVQSIERLNYYAEGLLDFNQYFDLTSEISKCLKSKRDKKDMFASLIDLLRTQSWTNIFSHTKFSDITTSKIQKEFQSFKLQQSKLPFTAKNMISLFDQLFFGKEEIFKRTIEDAFDKITSYYSGNRLNPEGWKTNDQWMVKKKVILPYYTSDYEKLRNFVSHNYGSSQNIIDIEKAMCFLDGRKHSEINSITNNDCILWGKKYESQYFYFRIYKKGTYGGGTIHLEFKDEYLYQQFNRIACEGKNWIKAA